MANIIGASPDMYPGLKHSLPVTSNITPKINPRLGFVFGGTPAAAIVNNAPPVQLPSFPKEVWTMDLTPDSSSSWSLWVAAVMALLGLFLIKSIVGVFR